MCYFLVWKASQVCSMNHLTIFTQALLHNENGQFYCMPIYIIFCWDRYLSHASLYCQIYFCTFRKRVYRLFFIQWLCLLSFFGMHQLNLMHIVDLWHVNRKLWRDWGWRYHLKTWWSCSLLCSTGITFIYKMTPCWCVSLHTFGLIYLY